MLNQVKSPRRTQKNKVSKGASRKGASRKGAGRKGASRKGASHRGASRKSAGRKSLQSSFAFPAQWGGKRAGAGRKPKNPQGPGVSHARRPLLASRFPVHVSLKIRAGLPSLREMRLCELVLQCLRRSQERQGFRLVHFSIQERHLHLLVEAPNARTLSLGMQSLSIRLAKQLNKALGTSGKVFADRYYGHVLKTPTETRNALVYVLNNSRRHKAQHGERFAWGWIDPLSSGPHFDGWKDAYSRSTMTRSTSTLTLGTTSTSPLGATPKLASPLGATSKPRTSPSEKTDFERDCDRDEEQVGVKPKTWLLRTGWKFRGLLSVNDVPGPSVTRKRNTV